MKRLFALVFCMILLFVFISCGETTSLKTESETTPETNKTENVPATSENESEKLPETGAIISTESIPPQTTSSSTTTTTTVPPTTTAVPITTTVKPTTKAPPVTTTAPKTTTAYPTYGATLYVAPNKNLTWEEAYKDNGDGTFTLTYRSGHVTKYYPHPEVEGHFTPSLQRPSDLRLDGIKGIWDLQICRVCGEFSVDVNGYVKCIRYTRDKNCPHCGVFVEAMACHYCAN